MLHFAALACRALFKDRDCFSLIRPMNDEQALANLDSVPRDQLRPEFSQVRGLGSGGRVGGLHVHKTA